HAQTVGGLRTSRAQTPAAAYVDESEVAAVAARWRNLHGRLEGHEQRRTELTKRYHTLTGQRRYTEGAIAQLKESRAHFGGVGRIRRATRDQAAELDAQLERHRRDQQRLDGELDHVRLQLTMLPDDEHLQPLREERARAGGQLLAVIQARIAAALQNPPDYVLLTIGRQPDGGPERAAWRDAVHAVEHYRTCWGIVDPQRPLGDQPTEPVMREERQRAARRLLDAIPYRETGRSLEDGRALHRGISV
ncbi:MAG: hypothetical protein M3O70_11835, partial [Actinomycetota bacterium]|nr:hypothetical protein [Actinomycetota bacterium]